MSKQKRVQGLCGVVLLGEGREYVGEESRVVGAGNLKWVQGTWKCGGVLLTREGSH